MAGSSVERLVEGYGKAVEHAGDDDRKRVGIVARLMTHYYVPEMTAHERKCQAFDWRSDLAEFSVSIVDEACAEYRRDEREKRPTPAAIRERCFAVRAKRQMMLPAPEDRITPMADGTGVPAWLADVWRDGGLVQRRQWIAARELQYAKAEAWRKQKRRGEMEGFTTPARALGVTAEPQEAEDRYL